MVKCVIFDFDGTLADTLPICVDAFQKTVEHFLGKRLNSEEILSFFGPSEEGSLKQFVPDRLDEALNKFYYYYKEAHLQCPGLFNGIKEILDYLKNNGVKLALVTGKGRKSCEIALQFYGIENIFEQIETGAPQGDVKTENIKKVLENLGASPEETIYVGDAPTDIIASRANNISVVSALWGSMTNEKAVKELEPDQIFYNISDFEAFIKSAICESMTAL